MELLSDGTATTCAGQSFYNLSVKTGNRVWIDRITQHGNGKVTTTKLYDQTYGALWAPIGSVQRQFGAIKQAVLVQLPGDTPSFGIAFHASLVDEPTTPDVDESKSGDTAFFLDLSAPAPGSSSQATGGLTRIFGPGDNDYAAAIKEPSITWSSALQRANGDLLVAFTYLSSAANTGPSLAQNLVFRRTSPSTFELLSTITSGSVLNHDGNARATSELCAADGPWCLENCWSGMWFPTLYETRAGELLMVAVEQQFHGNPSDPKCSQLPPPARLAARDDSVILLRASATSPPTWRRELIYKNRFYDQNEPAIAESIAESITGAPAPPKLVVVFHSRDRVRDPLLSAVSPEMQQRDGDLMLSESTAPNTWTLSPRVLRTARYNLDHRQPRLQGCGDRLWLTYTNFTRFKGGDDLYNPRTLASLSPDGGTTWTAEQFLPQGYEVFIGPSAANAGGHVKDTSLTFGLQNNTHIPGFTQSDIKNKCFSVTAINFERCNPNPDVHPDGCKQDGSNWVAFTPAPSVLSTPVEIKPGQSMTWTVPLGQVTPPVPPGTLGPTVLHRVEISSQGRKATLTNGAWTCSDDPNMPLMSRKKYFVVFPVRSSAQGSPSPL